MIAAQEENTLDDLDFSQIGRLYVYANRVTRENDVLRVELQKAANVIQGLRDKIQQQVTNNG